MSDIIEGPLGACVNDGDTDEGLAECIVTSIEDGDWDFDFRSIPADYFLKKMWYEIDEVWEN